MAAQRLIGAVVGAVAAGLLLLIPVNEHGVRPVAIDFALTVVAIVLFVHGAAIRFFNYARYSAAIAAGVLTIVDLTQPSNYSAEGYRVLWTLIGVAIGVVVMLLSQLLARRNAHTQAFRSQDLKAAIDRAGSDNGLPTLTPQRDSPGSRAFNHP